MARVIAGQAGGRRLAVPAGRDTRPTSDRAREGLFASMASIVGPLAGLRLLDLYAGSGAVGLEALSRGAAHVLLVESGAAAVRVIRANVTAIGLPGARVLADRVERVLVRGPDTGTPGTPASSAPAGSAPADGAPADSAPADGMPAGYDIVFADPPYAMADNDVTRMLRALADHGWLAGQALVIVERATRSGALSWPDGYVADRVRRYGEATFWYGRRAGTDHGLSAFIGQGAQKHDSRRMSGFL